MPHHITNRLKVSGESEAVKKLFMEIRTEDENKDIEVYYIDFNKLIPMPKSLEIEVGTINMGVESVMRTINKELEYYIINNKPITIETKADLLKLYIENENDPELIKIAQQRYDNIQNYGAATWREWVDENWGAIWNAYNQEQIDENTIKFDTAWLGVPDLITVLAKRFQELDFFYQYADINAGYTVGEYRFQNGVCIDMCCPEDTSPEAYKIAADVLGEELFIEGSTEEYEMEQYRKEQYEMEP